MYEYEDTMKSQVEQALEIFSQTLKNNLRISKVNQNKKGGINRLITILIDCKFCFEAV
ncbi:MAG: hypothetical protein M3405_13730 [Acidobacteriota bacterium]|nr:hypothetical protein [Acidobacteriota bacterium]